MKNILIISLLLVGNAYGMKRTADDFIDYPDHVQLTNAADNIPTDIGHSITLHVDPVTLPALACTNKWWQAVVNDESKYPIYFHYWTQKSETPPYLLAPSIYTRAANNYFKTNKIIYNYLHSSNYAGQVPSLGALDPLYTFENNNGWLHIAAQSGSGKLDELINVLKPDFNKKNNSGQTALMVAANKQAAEILAPATDLELKDNQGMTALFKAVREDKPELVAVLLKSGANKNTGIPTKTLTGATINWPLFQEALFRDNRAILHLLGIPS